jgi:hypothetical protein
MDVAVALIAPERLTLEFSRVEIGALGHSNWYKGVLLLAFYLILAAMFYLTPP